MVAVAVWASAPVSGVFELPGSTTSDSTISAISDIFGAFDHMPPLTPTTLIMTPPTVIGMVTRGYVTITTIKLEEI